MTSLPNLNKEVKMVYYNARYNVLGVTLGAYNTIRTYISLLEFTDDGHGLFVLTPEWICVGAL